MCEQTICGHTLSSIVSSINPELAISAASASPVNTYHSMQIIDTTFFPSPTNTRIELRFNFKLRSRLVQLILYSSETIASIAIRAIRDKISTQHKIDIRPIYQLNNIIPLLGNLQILFPQDPSVLNKSAQYATALGLSFHRLLRREQSNSSSLIIAKAISLPVAGIRLSLKLGSGYIHIRYLIAVSGLFAIFDTETCKYNWRSLSFSYSKSAK